MPQTHLPWNDDVIIEWDEENIEHIARHGVAPWEVDELILTGGYEGIRHPKRKKERKYQKRFVLNGRTIGGRSLVVLVDLVGENRLRPASAWPV